MKISSRVDYALSCVLHIVEHYRANMPVSVKYISERESLNIDYVEQLLIALKKAGILKSVRGIKGGYLLTSSPRTITAYNIMKAIDGDIVELVCFRKKGRKRKCIHIDRCQVRKLWIGLREEIEAYLKNNTLEHLLQLRKKEKK